MNGLCETTPKHARISTKVYGLKYRVLLLFYMIHLNRWSLECTHTQPPGQTESGGDMFNEYFETRRWASKKCGYIANTKEVNKCLLNILLVTTLHCRFSRLFESYWRFISLILRFCLHIIYWTKDSNYFLLSKQLNEFMFTSAQKFHPLISMKKSRSVVITVKSIGDLSKNELLCWWFSFLQPTFEIFMEIHTIQHSRGKLVLYFRACCEGGIFHLFNG